MRRVITGIGLIAAAPAWAAGSASLPVGLDLDALMAMEVKVSALQATDLAHAPGTVRVVTAAQMRERGYRHLGELLADMPGIQVQRMTDGTAWNRTAVRGISGNNKLLILQDGVRVNSPTGEAIPLDFNFPLFDIERVEVVYGPASALYGADALSGVVNLVTRNSAQTRSQVGAELGEDGFYASHAQFARKLDNGVGVSFGAFVQDYDGQNLKPIYPAADRDTGFGGETTTDAVRLPTRSHSYRLRVDFNPDWRLSLSESYMRNSTHTSGETPVENYENAANYNTLIRVAALEGGWHLGGDWRMQLKLDHATYEVDNSSKFDNSYTTWTGGYKYAEGRRTQIEPQLLWQRGDHSVTLGASYADFFSLPKTPNLSSPYDGSQAVDKVDYRNQSLYGEWTAHWGRGWRTVAGVRYDDASDYGSSLNPRLNVVYDLDARNTLRGGYGQAFLAPAPFFIYEQYWSFGPSPGLKPERETAYDLGWQHRFGNEHWLDLSIYQTEVRDVIYAGSGRNENSGVLKNQGAELGYAIRLDPAWSAWLNLGWLDGKLDRQGATRESPFTAEWRGTAGLTWKRAQVSVTPSVEFSSASAPGLGTTYRSSPGYALFNLYARWGEMGVPGMALTLRVHNLFDRRWYQPGDTGGAFDAVPQETRRIWLGLNYDW